MKRLPLAITIISSILFNTSALGACSPNKKEFDGSSVIMHNWKLLSGLGLTRELHPSGIPTACRRLQYFGSHTGQVSDTQRCQTIDDYGIGSFDPVKSDYCKHDKYILVLHEESANVWRVYKLAGYAGAKSGLTAEFDKNGNAVPISTVTTDAIRLPNPSAPSSTQESIQLPAPTATNPLENILKNGVTDLLKGLGR